MNVEEAQEPDFLYYVFIDKQVAVIVHLPAIFAAAAHIEECFAPVCEVDYGRRNCQKDDNREGIHERTVMRITMKLTMLMSVLKSENVERMMLIGLMPASRFAFSSFS